MVPKSLPKVLKNRLVLLSVSPSGDVVTCAKKKERERRGDRLQKSLFSPHRKGGGKLPSVHVRHLEEKLREGDLREPPSPHPAAAAAAAATISFSLPLTQ